jgi:hypothetical protein
MVVREMAGVTESLSVLMGNLEKAQAHGEMPSWVPDWSISPEPFELERLQLASSYSASLDRFPAVKFFGESVLETPGFQVDVVKAVSSPMTSADGNEALATFKEWYRLAELHCDPNRPYIRGATWIQAYWRTLCAGATDVYDLANGLWLPGTDDETPNTEDPLPTASTADAIDGTAPEPDTATIDHAIRLATMKRTFFLTGEGYMGLGPHSMSVDDLVYLLIGGKTPFILRSANNRTVGRLSTKLCHQLIGDCYLHGIMYGEAMEDYESKRCLIYLV